MSASNTKKEMARKRREYFAAGVRLLWIIDPNKYTVEVYTSAKGKPVILKENDVLDGGGVLPGFPLSLKEFFAEVDRMEGGS